MVIDDIHCHHRVPKQAGGTDKYQNLFLVRESVHRLIHATNSETITKYMDLLNLTIKQLKTLNQFRSLVSVEVC